MYYGHLCILLCESPARGFLSICRNSLPAFSLLNSMSCLYILDESLSSDRFCSLFPRLCVRRLIFLMTSFGKNSSLILTKLYVSNVSCTVSCLRPVS